MRRVKAAGQLLGMMMVIGVRATLLSATDSISKSWSAIDSWGSAPPRAGLQRWML